MRSSWIKLAQGYATAALHGAERQIQRRFPELLLMGDPDRSVVALSFDDGPHPHDTPALLAVLARHRVTATFSWLGERAEARPDLVREAAAAGHQLMIHGYRHRSFLIKQREELGAMLAGTQQFLATHSGRDPAQITGVRPPFGFPATAYATVVLLRDGADNQADHVSVVLGDQPGNIARPLRRF